jgi:hypothetical protein
MMNASNEGLNTRMKRPQDMRVSVRPDVQGDLVGWDLLVRLHVGRRDVDASTCRCHRCPS